ncbi:hypothetical protein PL81_41110 [Streptomyces sp. RSD-27]|nr:hypothetical protein PL81_41110 [Streptomyces sp. RSD-27]
MVFGNRATAPYSDLGRRHLAARRLHARHRHVLPPPRQRRTFYFRHDDGTVTSQSYGDTGDTPVAGDWNGDGHTTQGVVHS